MFHIRNYICYVTTSYFVHSRTANELLYKRFLKKTFVIKLYLDGDLYSKLVDNTEKVYNANYN